MGAILLAGLLTVVILQYQKRPRRWILAGWWIVFLLSLLWLRHHITSGLGLGLTW